MVNLFFIDYALKPGFIIEYNLKKLAVNLHFIRCCESGSPLR